MSVFTSSRHVIAGAVACCTLLSVPLYIPEATAAGFIDDASLTGGVYYWQRHRERKDLNPDSDKFGQYQQNLHHSTFNSNLDFSSGYVADIIGLDLAVFGALEMSDKGPAAPNEIGFSDANTRWDEKWSGDKNGTSLYKAALKVKLNDFWLRAGYLQPQGQTLLAPNWSFYRAPIAEPSLAPRLILQVQGRYHFPICGAMSIRHPGMATPITSARLMAKRAFRICIR